MIDVFQKATQEYTKAVCEGEDKKIQALSSAIAKTSGVITNFEASTRLERERQAALLQLELELESFAVATPGDTAGATRRERPIQPKLRR